MINNKSHITNYILSLAERTQVLKDGEHKIGFDWVIYQYGLSKKWQPIRLPFNREMASITHKTEAEFGIDLCFWDKKNKSIISFVLKADKLTYANWLQKGFKDDIERALTPNFDNIGINLSKIKTYKIITVYNKDDNKDGINSYENLVKSSNRVIYQNINIDFDRWNIDKLVEEVIETTLTPDVLPSHLSGVLTYISSQFNDFDYGTTQWQNQLVPNWKNFLTTVFKDNKSDERCINLIPFALLILKNNSKDSPNKIVAWIDLIEWAMLKLWEIFPKSNKKNKILIINILFDFYITELRNYFYINEGILCSYFGVKVYSQDMSLIPINTANSLYWHIGRLGILGISAVNLPQGSFKQEWFNKYQTYLKNLINQNPLSHNPLVDIHHIEIFEIFLLYLLNDKKEDLFEFFDNLLLNLHLRRQENPPLPFIESSNRIELVAERLATGTIPVNWNEASSYLLTMLLEMTLVFDDKVAQELMEFIFQKIIIGNKKQESNSIDLVSWTPPKDWDDIVFKGIQSTGTGINTANFADFSNQNRNKIEIIKEFIKESQTRDIKIPKLERFLVLYILACIKNKTPLPPEFWRAFIFENQK